MGTAVASTFEEAAWEVQRVRGSPARSFQIHLAWMDPVVFCLNDAQNLICGDVELALTVGYDVVEFSKAFHLLARCFDAALELRV